jgi:hypothetical protein
MGCEGRRWWCASYAWPKQWPVIENQSSGDFIRGTEKALVRHYPYFKCMVLADN